MTKTTTAYVIFADGFRVEVDVARTEAAHARGLMFRSHLDEHEGMLFVFEVARRYGFWMKNVPIELDIIWLDAQGRVVWIVKNAPPCTSEPCPMYVPDVFASYVVEVVGGFVDRHSVTLGDSVAVNW